MPHRGRGCSAGAGLDARSDEREDGPDPLKSVEDDENCRLCIELEDEPKYALTCTNLKRPAWSMAGRASTP